MLIYLTEFRPRWRWAGARSWSTFSCHRGKFATSTTSLKATTTQDNISGNSDLMYCTIHIWQWLTWLSEVLIHSSNQICWTTLVFGLFCQFCGLSTHYTLHNVGVVLSTYMLILQCMFAQVDMWSLRCFFLAAAPKRSITNAFTHMMSFFSLSFLVADKRLYKRLCPSVRPSVRWSVGPSVSTSRKVGKRAFPPLPTRPRLVLAVYPALLFPSMFNDVGNTIPADQTTDLALTFAF